MNFNSILIGSEDPERLADYYRRVLGEPGFTGDGYTSWMIGSGSVTVGPHTEVKGRNSAPGRLIWNIESDDVRGDFDRFQAAGATVVKAPYEFAGHAGDVDRDLLRPRRQLLPARQPDVDVGLIRRVGEAPGSDDREPAARRLAPSAETATALGALIVLVTVVAQVAA